MVEVIFGLMSITAIVVVIGGFVFVMGEMLYDVFSEWKNK
tara:strand:+ start:6119 stop:6238 length:120 start_codon:yes stop_codon:yes gene_type:complete